MKKYLNIFHVCAFALLTSCITTQIPSPEKGSYVGTIRIDLIDTSRAEKYRPEDTVKRKITAQIWYPAESIAGYLRDFYIGSDLSSAMQKYMGIPGFLIGSRQHSNSYINAPISNKLDKYPVIIFNHGYGSYGKQNYSQMESLASKGFFVFSISHPYTSILTEFADGTMFERSENEYWSSMNELQKNINQTGSWYASFLEENRKEISAQGKLLLLHELSKGPLYALLQNDFETWVSDTIFLVDSLSELNNSSGILYNKLDYEKLGLYGHSFGGSVSSQVALQIPGKIKAGINLDGPCLIYEYPGPFKLQTPFMFVYSTHLKIGNVVCNHTGLNDALYLESDSDSYSVTVQGSAHHNFTDMTYIPFLKKTSMLGPIDSVRAGAITDEIISIFFDKYLNGSAIELCSLEKYPELRMDKSHYF